MTKVTTMVTSVLKRWESNDPDDDAEFGWLESRAMPFIEEITGPTDMQPAAPIGWWAIVRLPTVTTISTVDIAVWISCLRFAQGLSAESAMHTPLSRPTRARHLITREPDGARVLLTHPSLKDWMQTLTNGLNADCAGGSTCGFEEVLPDLQIRAGKTLVRRLWRRAPLSLRVRTLINANQDAAHALSKDLGWIDAIGSAEDLSHMLFVEQTEMDI